ncbi:hypothetical protein DFH28DRAFT_1216707 [Melampsora americana]|nr:hypothetical protein DFH28DRAFT_1216707 [Melampsora americana]
MPSTKGIPSAHFGQTVDIKTPISEDFQLSTYPRSSHSLNSIITSSQPLHLSHPTEPDLSQLNDLTTPSSLIIKQNSLPNPISTTINPNKIPFKPKDQSITMTSSTPTTTLTSINNHHSNHHHHHYSNHHHHHHPSNHHLHHQTQS